MVYASWESSQQNRFRYFRRVNRINGKSWVDGFWTLNLENDGYTKTINPWFFEHWIQWHLGTYNSWWHWRPMETHGDPTIIGSDGVIHGDPVDWVAPPRWRNWCPWGNRLFLWQFSIAMLNYQRVVQLLSLKMHFWCLTRRSLCPSISTWYVQNIPKPYTWVNYNDPTATSLESLVNKGNHPLLWPNYSGYIVNYCNLPRYTSIRWNIFPSAPPRTPRICVDSCPTGNSTSHICWDEDTLSTATRWPQNGTLEDVVSPVANKGWRNY